MTKSGLAKHLLTCGKRDRSRCLVCKQEFTTYTGVRLHEQKAHPEVFNEQKRGEIKRPDSEIFTILANIEAKAPKKTPFLSQMVRESGLTKDQVRHRREKPIYQEYLRSAKLKIKDTSMAVKTRAGIGCPAREKKEENGAGNSNTPNEDQDATEDRLPQEQSDSVAGECIDGGEGMGGNIANQEKPNKTGGKRIREESMSPLSQPAPRRLCRAESDTAPPIAERKTPVVVDESLREFLAVERGKALVDNNNAPLDELCDAGLTLPNSALVPFLDKWIEQQFQNKGGAKRGGRKGVVRATYNYGGTDRGVGPRASTY
nr:unnamed protein product [Callosobruchus chinensis]